MKENEKNVNLKESTTTKAKEELKVLKEEVEVLNKKPSELNEEELNQANGGVQILPKDHYENIITKTSEYDEQILQTYKKDIGSDKNAKVIYT